MEEAEDVIEARSQLHTQDSALRPMLVVLRIWEHFQLQYR